MGITLDCEDKEPWAAGETKGCDHSEVDIGSMPPRLPSSMVAREIVVWTPTRLLDATLSRFVWRRRGVRVMPQIDLVE